MSQASMNLSENMMPFENITQEFSKELPVVSTTNFAQTTTVANSSTQLSLLQTLLTCLTPPALDENAEPAEYQARLDESLDLIKTHTNQTDNEIFKQCAELLSHDQQLRQNLDQQRNALLGA